MSLKELIKRNDLLMYFYRSIKSVNNNDIKHYVINKGHLPYVIKAEFKTYNTPIIYYIESGNGVSGFFAEYRRLIDALAYADFWGFKSYVLYKKEYPYAEDGVFLGTINPFEYYFIQDPEFKEKNINELNKVKFDEQDRFYIYEGINRIGMYEMEEKDEKIYIDRAAEIVKKHIHFNSITEKYLQENIAKLLAGKKTLGVHARGGEWRKPVKGHPVAIPLEEHINEVKRIMNAYDFEQVFLATDEIDAIDEFKKNFGSSLVYYEDTYRGAKGECLAFSKNERENHKYRMGLEVLRDAETLVYCDGLIAGLSNISLYVKIKKKVFNRQFEYIHIQDKGTNKHGVEASKVVTNQKNK